MLLICIVYQGTYSYFSAGVSGTGNSTTASPGNTATLSDIVITEGDINSSLTMIPGDSVSSTFTIANPNKAKVCFGLNWTNVVNNFVNKSDLIVTLENASGDMIIASGSKTAFPSADGSLATGLSLAAEASETYTLTVTYLNTESNQWEDIDKDFSADIEGVLTTCPTP